MYARYVPSAGGVLSAEPTQKPAPAESQSATPATMAAPTAYARFVPGDGGAKQNIAAEDRDERPAKKAKLSPEPEVSATKPRKKRKSKQRTSAVDSDSDDSSSAEPESKVAENHIASSSEDEAAPPATMEIDERDSTPVEAVQKKPKREKKPKARVTSDTANSGSEDEIQKRHKAVFDRKRKSMQIPTATKDQAGSEDATMEDVPSPEEAHGLEPLPQPKPAEIEDFVPTFETLPAWLAEPIRVSPQA
ncbi:hypothetical protein Micbo1qcDRAFT_155062, partial [Microdochium bolleyi]